MPRRPSAKSTIRPKISTMPRQKSEAAAFLNIYKLVIEKKRLQEELENIEERREQIHQRLAVLDQQVAHLEGNVQRLREQDNAGSSAETQRSQPQSTSQGEFNTFYLDY